MSAFLVGCNSVRDAFVLASFALPTYAAYCLRANWTRAVTWFLLICGVIDMALFAAGQAQCLSCPLGTSTTQGTIWYAEYIAIVVLSMQWMMSVASSFTLAPGTAPLFSFLPTYQNEGMFWSVLAVLVSPAVAVSGFVLRRYALAKNNALVAINGPKPFFANNMVVGGAGVAALGVMASLYAPFFSDPENCLTWNLFEDVRTPAGRLFVSNAIIVAGVMRLYYKTSSPNNQSWAFRGQFLAFSLLSYLSPAGAISFVSYMQNNNGGGNNAAIQNALNNANAQGAGQGAGQGGAANQQAANAVPGTDLRWSAIYALVARIAVMLFLAYLAISLRLQLDARLVLFEWHLVALNWNVFVLTDFFLWVVFCVLFFVGNRLTNTDGGLGPCVAFGEWMFNHKWRTLNMFVGGAMTVMIQLYNAKNTYWIFRGLINAIHADGAVLIKFHIVVFLGIFAMLATVAHTYANHDGPRISWFWRFLYVLPIVLSLYTMYAQSVYVCDLELGKEYLNGNITIDGKTDAQFVQELIKKRAGDSTDGVALRDVHPKAHGCVHATFQVEPTMLKSNSRFGVFSTLGAEFNAWVRFSNGAGAAQADSKPDVRGVAIKLVDVPGPKLFTPEEDPEQNTQDFLLITSDTFIFSDTSTYINFLNAADKKGMAMVNFVFPTWYDPRTWNVRTLIKTAETFFDGWFVKNVFDTTFFSATPYSSGVPDNAIKYRLQPCPENEAFNRKFQSSTEGDNYIRHNMEKYLQESDACYDLQFMEQSPARDIKSLVMACLNPIEDCTRSWVGLRANPIEWVNLGRLRIPKQDFTHPEQDKFCRNLSFTPWHSRPENRPLGGTNRIRRTVYLAAANMRSGINDVKRGNVSGTIRFDGSTGKTLKPVTLVDSPHVEVVNDVSLFFRSLPDRANMGDTFGYRYAKYTAPWNQMAPYFAQSPIPETEQFSPEKMKDIFGTTCGVGHVAFNSLYQYLTSNHWVNYSTTSFTDPQQYEVFMEDVDPSKTLRDSCYAPRPAITKYWKDDRTFAHQFIAGINPMVIRTATAVPKAFDMTPEKEARLDSFLKGKVNKDLKTLFAEGRIFVADYELLNNAYSYGSRVLYAPIVLLFIDDATFPKERVLMPLAIQLTRGSSAVGHELYYPTDGLAWMFARLHVTSSDVQFHESISHLGATHLTMESIIVGFHRQLTFEHPIKQLMLPHFQETIAINNLGRNSLLAPTESLFEAMNTAGRDGFFDLMQKSFLETWNFTDSAFPRAMAKRGFPEVVPDSAEDKLPNFFYRDDGYKVWNAELAYCRAAVNQVYANDAAVANDVQIQSLLVELGDPNAGSLHGLPEVKTREQLADFLATIMFTCSAQHSALNYGQYEFYAFTPNRPTVMNLPMPARKEEVTMDYIMRSLPGWMQTYEVIQLVRTLSLPTRRSLDVSAKTLEKVFPHPTASFLAELLKITGEIRYRNDRKAEQFPYYGTYTYLIPTEVATSIEI